MLRKNKSKSKRRTKSDSKSNSIGSQGEPTNGLHLIEERDSEEELCEDNGSERHINPPLHRSLVGSNEVGEKEEEMDLQSLETLRCVPSERLKWVELKSYTELAEERKVWARFICGQDIA